MASAQITIEAADIPQTVGDSGQYKYCASEATVNNGESGGPQTWTFDTSAYTGYVLTTTVVDKATTPLGDRFPEANLVTSEPRGQYTLFVYDKLQVDALLECGYGIWFGSGGRAWVQVPAVRNVQFPATLGTSWQTDYTVHDTLNADTVDVVAGTRWCSIDAWGTAVTPVGSYPCLRANWVGLAVTTHYIGGTPVGVDTSLTRRFLWVAKHAGTVAMTHSMEGDTSLNFTRADDYMVMVQTSSGVAEEAPEAGSRTTSAGSSIVRNVLLLPSSLLSPHSSLLSSDGRKVLDLGPGANDLRALAPGIYFHRLEIDDATLTRKVIKVD